MISTSLAGPGGAITAAFGEEVRSTRDKLPAHHRANIERQASVRTHIHTKGQSGIACNHLNTPVALDTRGFRLHHSAAVTRIKLEYSWYSDAVITAASLYNSGFDCLFPGWSTQSSQVWGNSAHILGLTGHLSGCISASWPSDC